MVKEKLRLKISYSGTVEILNPDLHIATVSKRW